jgi:hypothetical protein
MDEFGRLRRPLQAGETLFGCIMTVPSARVARTFPVGGEAGYITGAVLPVDGRISI